MRSKFFQLLLLFVLATGFAGHTCLAQSSGAQRQKHELTISAAISLKDALDEIAALYRAEQPDTILHLNFGGSGTLEHQIEQGAPVDLFISASPLEMDRLASKRLILAETRRDLVKNRVVLIVSSGNSTIGGFQDLTRPEVKFLAIGEPQTVPAGKYAQEVLTHLGLYESLKSKLVLAKDVRQVLTYVETGNADAGIVYLTDARITTRVKIVATAPEGTHAPVIYPIAVMKDTKDAQGAKSFLQFLFNAKARPVFEEYGFIPPN